MIIRRCHTANFTTIGNVLFEDERLALDEVGLMSWLLSRPNDWQVRRPALMRRFKVGRDGMRRIMRSLLRFGWIRAQITRLSDGRVHILYEVRDEPGPELSEDEARAALSLVSSGAGPSESADDDGSEDGTEEAGEASPDADPGGGSPPTGQPESASRLRPSPPGYKKEKLKTDSQRTESTKGVRAFQAVLSKWNPDHVLSRIVCEGLHAALTDADQEAAVKYAGPYVSDRSSQGAKLCDLATYYRERRWERLAVKSSAVSGTFHVRAGTPQAFRWREYLERTEPQKLKMFDLTMDRNGYTAPSEWPPPLPPKPAIELSDSDSHSLTK